jgi:hypothetical protein
MNYLADPAVLGSIVMGAVLSGWLLGRQHAAARMVGSETPGPAPEPLPEPQAAIPPEARGAAVTACQHAARAERRQVIEAARSLGELHAEVTAYRLQEQVLASALSDGLLVELIPGAARGDCRYLGLIGQPTCPLPGTGHETCTSREGCAAASRRMAQPAAEASALTRV